MNRCNYMSWTRYMFPTDPLHARHSGLHQSNIIPFTKSTTTTHIRHSSMQSH
jgi:hypothetical protein